MLMDRDHEKREDANIYLTGVESTAFPLAFHDGFHYI